MKNFFRRFFKQEPIIKFEPHTGAPNLSKLTNIQLASDVTPKWLLNQRDYENNRDKFQNCPGMTDLMRAGYIITAWDDIHLKANRQGVVCKMEKRYTEPMAKMSERVVAGIAPVAEGFPLMVQKIPTPWSITTKKGYSAFVLPATFHSPFLGDLHVYGGINDYEEFHTVNFIFAPLKECEVFIPAGTPLLHVIPYKREEVIGATGNNTKQVTDKHRFSFPTRVRGAYRKFFHKRKIFKLEHKHLEDES